MKLIFVRHGDPDYEHDSLTERGRVEADLLAERLCKLTVKDFYCSPLGRARATAAPTLARLGREARIMPWLQEFPAHVEHSGSDAAVAWDWYPADWTARADFFDRDRWRDHPLFAAAGLPAIADEVERGIDEVLAEHGYLRDGLLYRVESANEDTFVFFCHFGLEAFLLAHLLNISPMVLWHGTCAAPSSVTTVVTEERQKSIASFRMLAFGDTAHLAAANVEPSFAARFCETYDNAEQRH